MRIWQIWATGILGAVSALAAPVGLQAASIVPGSVLIPAAAEAEPSGGLIIATAATPFSVPGAFSGTLYSDVISGDAANPLGGLTFVYRVTNDGVSGPNSIGRLSIDDFFGFLTDASYNPSAGVAPASIDRNVSADVIGFNFLPTPVDPLAGFLAPGASSARLIVQTNSPAYKGGLASLIDGGVISVATFAPAAVPEPGMGVLAALSLAGLVAARRRR
ncbi:MAG: hypothetical protein U0795_06575 [Pirellulales bacterium]